MSRHFGTTGVLARKELAMLFNAPATYVIAVFFLMILGWLFISPLFQVNLTTLDTFWRPLPLIFTFIVPALTMRAFSEELRSGTIEYLSTLPIEDHEIVLGKYLGSMGLLGSLMLLTLVYPVLLGFIGSPDWGQVIGTYLAIAGLGSFFVAVGLWSSALTRNQVVAFIVAFFVCFAFFMLGRIADFLPGMLANIVRGFSLEAHFDSLARGVIDTRDVLFWLTGTLFFLMACLTVVQSRKWR